MASELALLNDPGAAQLLGGALAMMAGAFCISAVVGQRLDRSPGLRALAHAGPIAIAMLVIRIMWHEQALLNTCIGGAWKSRTLEKCLGGDWQINTPHGFRTYEQISISLLFGTSVALLSTVVGSVASIAPIGQAPGRWRQIWAFMLTATLITFLAGFSGSITWFKALILLAEGAIALWLWRDSAASTFVAAPIPSQPSASPRPRSTVLLIVASLALVGFGAFIGARGAIVFGSAQWHVPPSTLASTLLSLSLVMPALQNGRRLATAGTTWVPMTSQCGVVLINLCLLLPLLALGPYAWAHGSAWIASMADHPVEEITTHVLNVPLAVWRIDSLLLVVLSTLYLPVALGRWNLGKEDGALLVVVYFAYLIASVVVTFRPW